jgi:hypothetical protein
MEPETTQAVAENAEEQASPAQDDKTVSELERARRDAAKYRTERNELQAKWKEAEPVLAAFQAQQEAQKSEAQKAAERTAAAEAKVTEAEAKVTRLAKEKQLLLLATKANVDIALLDYLDLDKLDLEDEKKALEVLGKLATAKAAGSVSNPGRNGASQLSDDDIRAEVYGKRRKSGLFGG